MNRGPGRACRLAVSLLIGSIGNLGHAADAERLLTLDSRAGLASKIFRTPPIDAAPLCVPNGLDPFLSERLRSDAWSKSAARSAANELHQDPSQGAGGRGESLTALLHARAAATRREKMEAREALRKFHSSSASPDVAFCAYLERSRLDLQLGHFPEAAAHARLALAQQKRSQQSAESLAAAEFYHGEALHLGGRILDAAPIYRRLTTSSVDRIASAARLRFADALFDTGERAPAALDYSELVPDGETFGASFEGWGLRAAAAELAAGEPETAREWIERFETRSTTPMKENAAQLLLAQTFQLEERPAEAQKILAKLSEEDAGGRFGIFAELQLIGSLPPNPEDEELPDRLGLIARSAKPTNANFARLLLARELIHRDRPEQSLAILIGLARDVDAKVVLGETRRWLGYALEAAVAKFPTKTDCPELVRLLGWRRNTLIQHSASIDPLLRLGNCLEALGLQTAAQGLYASLSNAFGAVGAEKVALGRANVYLALGNIDRTRRIALPASRVEGPDQERWLVLLGETEVLEGRYAPAAERLLGVLSMNPDPATRIRANKTLAHAMARTPDPSLYVEALHTSIWTLGESDRGEDAHAIGYAALVAANTQRELDRRERALLNYDLARKLLPPGQRRAQANYWHATLRDGGANRREGLKETVRDRDAGPWGDLSETQLELELLKKRATEASDVETNSP